MSWNFFVRYFILTVTGIFIFLFILLLISLAPVNRTPAHLLPFYKTMMSRLDSLEIDIPEAETAFSVGFAKTNITPREPIATAGYGKRRGKPYHTVHDSIYVRALVIDNGKVRVAIVSADLLIMPPAVTEVLQEKLEAIGFTLNNTYLGATHTHNSIGHWGEGATRFIYGAHDDSVVHFIANVITRTIDQATQNLLPSALRSGKIAIPQAVENRLINGGSEDPFLRVLQIHRADSSKLVLASYAAHATCLSQSTLELSGDYPGMLVKELESQDYAFAMFLAGAVGSHKGSAPADDWNCMQWMTKQISEEFLAQRHTLRAVEDTSLVMRSVPLALSDPQIKISSDWKIRSWLFHSAFGEYQPFLTVLRIGDLVMLGTPCDFSGEFNPALDSAAGKLGFGLMVTSFNGGYIGYVTPGKYYNEDHYETQLMNWYAPGTGEYIQECLEKLMIAVSDTK
jgi:neutral ceramidase